MFRIIPNPDKEKYDEMTEAVKMKDGYYPCLVGRTKDTKCICLPFRERDYEGLCFCERFVKVLK